MNDLTAAFHSEVFRPIATVVVPGFAATSTISIALWQSFPPLQKLINDHPGTAATMMLLIVITLGLVAEDLGATLETCFDKKLKRVDGFEKHDEEWFEYLRLAFDKEPVGHRYLRTLVLRMKFELGMTIASVPVAFGGFWVHTSWHCRILIFLAALIAGLYFYHEAKSSNRSLSLLRREMLKRSWG